LELPASYFAELLFVVVKTFHLHSVFECLAKMLLVGSGHGVGNLVKEMEKR